MKRILLATAVACGLAMAAAADEAACGAETKSEAPKAEEMEKPAKPAPVVVELTGKIVAETAQNKKGEDVTVYALETEDGAKLPIAARKKGLPEGVELSAFAGKTVTLKGEVVERGDAGKVIKRVLAISAKGEE